MSDMNEGGMEMTDKPAPPLEETRYYRDTLVTSSDATELDGVVTPESPVVDRGQLPSQIEVRTISVTPQFSQLIVDGRRHHYGKKIQQVRHLSVLEKLNSAIENGKTGSDTQSYLSLAFEMIKSSGIYALGVMASPLIALVLTPFLTRHLTRTDYGSLAILNAIIDLVTIITQLGLIAAFIRAYTRDYQSPQDRLGVIATSIILLSLVSIPLAITMMITAPWLSEFLFNSPSFSESVRITALVILLENLTVPGLSWLRAEKRAIFFSALSIANLLFVLITNFVLVGMLQMGVNGALLATGIGNAAIVVCTLPMMLLLLARRQSLHLRSDIARNLLFFGLPIIFSGSASWVLQLSDRYLLSHFVSLAQTASYTVAYTLGNVLSPVVISPFALAWIPIMYAISKREDAPHIFRLVFRWFSFVLLFATFALSLLSTIILKMLFPPVYYSAEPIIPIITLSTMFTGIYYIFQIGMFICRKTKFEILFMSVAASVNLLLNIFLIPRFEAIGAAVSTLLAYIILVLVTYIVNQRIYPIKFEVGLFIISLFVGIALYIGSSLIAHTQKPLINWSISLGTLMLYGVFLMLLGGLTAKRLKAYIL
jgi:O-antigen/teichoic acid export membrane protein